MHADKKTCLSFRNNGLEKYFGTESFLDKQSYHQIGDVLEACVSHAEITSKYFINKSDDLMKLLLIN